YVLELDAELGGVQPAKARHRVGGGGLVVEAKRGAGDSGEIRVGDPVEFGLQLRCAEGRGAERIELDIQVAVLPDRLNQPRGPRNLAQVGRIESGRRGAPRSNHGSWRGAREPTAYLEVLPPRLIHREWVAEKRLVHLFDVGVVESAGDRKVAHD